MDILHYILIAIILICIVALIIVIAMRKKLGEKPPKVSKYIVAGTPPAIIPPPVVVPPVNNVVEVESASPFPGQMIYAYHSSTSHRLCPFCDGENSDKATECCICGQKI